MIRPWAFRTFFSLLIVVTVSSCSMDRYRSANHLAISISFPKGAPGQIEAQGGPANYPTIDCFLVDVNGAGITPQYDNSNPFAALDLGLNSAWFSRTSLIAAGSADLSVRLPMGKSRTIRILGVQGSPTPITNCSAQTFAGYPSSGAISAPPYPQVFELARTTVDVFKVQNITTRQVVNPATNLVPTAGLTATPVLGLATANANVDFSDGTPPTGGAFQTLTLPFSTDVQVGRARLDLVVDVTGLALTNYRGLHVEVQGVGGQVSCAAGPSPTITSASDLSLGFWNEATLTWTPQSAFIPASDQVNSKSTNFVYSGIANSTIAVTSGINTYSSYYLSLRVQSAPGTGCSAITVSSVTATVYQ